MSSFHLALKSTIDKLLLDAAKSNGYEFFDLDGVYMDADIAESSKPAIAWSLLGFTEAPRDPFWHLQFEVGARTAYDESQYSSMTIAAKIQETFPVASSFYIQDYSSDNQPSVNLGEVIISTSSTTPAEFDKVSGMRPVHITATVQRFPQ